MPEKFKINHEKIESSLKSWVFYAVTWHFQIGWKVFSQNIKYFKKVLS